MRRIVHVISSAAGIGGAERVLAALASAEQDGCQQAVVNIAGTNQELNAACAPSRVYSPTWPRARCVQGRWILGAALRALIPDIVHAHLPLAMLATATSRGKGDLIRLATHHHGDHFQQSGKRLAAHADHVAGGRFDVLVAPSDSVRKFLLERYGRSRPRIVTIRNGWAPIRSTPANVKRAEVPTIVSVANFRAQKNHELLIRAFALLHRELPEVRLLLVGDGPLRQQIRDLTVSLGVESSVDFAGYVEDVWPYLRQSHLFAIASRYEPLGIAVLEAMAAGLPVVATEIGGLREIVRPGVTGALVEPGDASALAAAMGEILRSEALTAAMGASARSAAQGYGAERMIDAYFCLYRELLARRNAPSSL